MTSITLNNSVKNTVNNRLEWIDYLKGFGIILVVVFHSIIPSLRNDSTVLGVGFYFVYKFLSAFIMPLFFFSSGYLFEHHLDKYTNKLKFIVKKARCFLVPYITYSVVNYLIISILLRVDVFARVFSQSSGGYKKVSFFEAFYQIITCEGNMDKHIWFTLALFLVFLFNILFPKVMKNPIILLMLFFIKIFISIFNPPYIIYHIFRSVFYFSFARYLYNNKLLKLNFKKTIFIIALFISFCSIYAIIGIYYEFSINLYLLNLLEAVSAVFACVAFGNLFQLLKKNKITKFFNYVGKHSYEIYLIHTPYLVNGLVAVLLLFKIPSIISCLLSVILGIFVPIIISIFILKKVRILGFLFLGESL